MKKEKHEKLTRRQIDKLRAESMRWASYMMARLRMSVLGKPIMEKCECGREHDLFPNQPTKLTSPQVNAVKLDIEKIYPGLTDEDLETPTGEKDPAEQWDLIATFIKEQGKVAQAEFAKRGVIVQIGKPELKVVNND